MGGRRIEEGERGKKGRNSRWFHVVSLGIRRPTYQHLELSEAMTTSPFY